MAADERIVIEIEFDDGTVKKGFIGVQKAADDTSKKVNKGLKKQTTNAEKLTRVTGNLIAAYAGFRTIVGVFRSLNNSIAKAAQQQDAVVQLNSSLALAGGFSQEASQSFQDMATEIQNVTTFGDELILSQTALARNFTNTNAEAEKLIRAAVDLSAATGLTLDSSVKNLGKTFAGLTGELGESVPILRTLTAEQLKAGAALDLISDRFGGAASNAVRTFSGASKQAGNTLGDAQEELGKFVTESDFVILALNDISKAFIDIGKSISDFRTENGNLVADVTTGVVKITQIVVAAFQGLGEFVTSILLGIVSGFATMVTGIVGTMSDFASIIVSALAPESKAAMAIKSFSEGTVAAFGQAGSFSAEAFTNAFTLDQTQGVFTFFDSIITRIDELKMKSAEIGNVVNQVVFDVEQATVAAAQGIDLAFAGFAEGFDTTSDNIAAAKAKVIADFKAMGNAARDGLGRSAGSAFAAFGKALANGENALEAFTKALISAIGQQAIAIGTEMILRGIGYSIDPLLFGFGPPLIAAGAALATFGGVLSAVGGGGGGGGGTGGGGGDPSVATSDASLGEAPELEEAKAKNEISLTVQGDVLDSDQTGLRIVDIIKDFTDKNGETEVFQS